MNTSEKIICLLLGAVLAWYIFSEAKSAGEVQKERAAELAAGRPAAAAASEVKREVLSNQVAAAATEAEQIVESGPEQIATLENDEVKIELTSRGAAVKKVTLKKYAQGRGSVSAENPPVVLDFSDSPLGASATVEACEVVSQGVDSVVFKGSVGSRTITLKAGYQIGFRDAAFGSGSISLGAMRMGNSKNDLLSVDSWALDAGKGKPGVIHHGDNDSPLKAYLVGGLAGGCSGAKSAAGMPEKTTVKCPGGQSWIAVKNRFFVTALVKCDEQVKGFAAIVKRDMNAANYRPESVTVKAELDVTRQVRETVFFVGPKKQALLWDLGMKDVMEFGMWRWLCYPLVWVMNLFHSMIPNYGVAIILLTILVRILFWPLTHKSTVGMKKMQEIQPLMKELQAKFKDNPQRLQQETFALYREHKVNPMSSCLPMLIQIPIFIALFNVLRSAVELRYAPFLWIGDLSEPEALFASWFPFGGLNILPILMAVSTALQSAFTPSTGDKKQQQMMMVMMPLMMLFMFYSFPSALSLYWFLSNLFSIVQMWLIRRGREK